VGNTNKLLSNEVLMNPKSLEPLSKKEIRLLGRLAVAAGVSLKEYVGKVNCTYPGTAQTRTH